MGNSSKRQSVSLGPLPRITVTDVDNPTPNGGKAWSAEIFDPEDPSRPSAIDQSNSDRRHCAMAIPGDGHVELKRFPTTRVLMDFALLAAVGFGMAILLHSIGPYQRGFFCDDESIRLPYKPSTVSTTALFVYALGITAVAILATEFYHLYVRSGAEIYSEYEVGRNLAERLAIRFILFYGYALLALVTTNVFTGIAKSMVGRLRPHFLQVCQPSVNLTDCAPYSHNYITDYVCTTHDPKMVARLSDSRLSFFSGHSSLSMCASAFVVIYLHSRLGHGQLRRSRMLVPLLQVAILCAGMFISYSRIFDHMHHSNDVLAGMLLGSGVATTTLLFGAGLDPRGGSRRCHGGHKSKRAHPHSQRTTSSPGRSSERSAVAYDPSVNAVVVTTTTS